MQAATMTATAAATGAVNEIDPQDLGSTFSRRRVRDPMIVLLFK